MGSKERDKTDPATDIYRVSALWLTNSKGQALLAQRKLTKKHSPGKWGPAVAGTIEEGETYESNIYKEAKEEIGLEGIKFRLADKKLIVRENRFFAQWFLGTVDKDISEFKIQEEEVEALEWVDQSLLAKDIVEHPEKYTSGALTWPLKFPNN